MGTYLLVTSYCMWTSVGLSTHVKCTDLSKEFIWNTSEKCVMEEGAVIV